MKKKIMLLFTAIILSFGLGLNVKAGEDDMPKPKSVNIELSIKDSISKP